MLFALTTREGLVQFLPNGGIGAEIGVAQGNFSKVLLDRAAPRELHLIDPWSHQESDIIGGGDLLARVARDPDAYLHPPAPSRQGEEMFRSVQERFSSDPRVRLHRRFSYRIAPTFPASFFDFIYVDGNHTYEFVLRDLLDFAPRMKPGGLILGHDFFHNGFADRENYGVMPAVQTFLKRTGYQFVALTYEPFSTYVLASDLTGFAAAFVENLIHSTVTVIRLPAELAFAYRDEVRPLRDGRERRIPAFTAAPPCPPG